MTRFLAIFGALLLIAFLLMAGLLAQNGYSLMDPKMTPMVFVAVLVAVYVSWRIEGILKRRDRTRGHQPDGTGKSGGFFSPKPSATQSARAARVAARRKKLIAEGKLEAETEPETPPTPEETTPTRVSQAAPIKDRMAARQERVRQAKEQGKL
jgi:hypothetical protein